MCKTGRFRAKSDPEHFLSRKKFAPKKFVTISDFKNEVFGKPDFGQKKPDPNVREVQNTPMIGGIMIKYHF